jgi:hypothetical protein
MREFKNPCVAQALAWSYSRLNVNNNEAEGNLNVNKQTKVWSIIFFNSLQLSEQVQIDTVHIDNTLRGGCNEIRYLHENIWTYLTGGTTN